MNVARRVIGLFQDSPNYMRDRANLLSGFTIGTTGLLLNAAVLVMAFPLMLDPDEPGFRALTETVEFGQLLALILLGGATVFATHLIPLRLAAVFWGPRVGGYFDQIVLSGITPIRFVIGKATSQNLFLGLSLFLLLPYIVLSLTLGGVNWGFFFAGLVLVWLYCMALTLVTLWVSLYFNELLSALFVIAIASAISVFGCTPLPRHAFAVTPFPVLVHPIYAAFPSAAIAPQVEFVPLFVASATAVSAVICLSLLGIYLGPLYGIIRENSTFGEVVRRGDSQRKRWLRFRYHIQRPSEIAFFYENRGDVFRRHEALVRWGLTLLAVISVTAMAFGGFLYWLLTWVLSASPNYQWAFEFHVSLLIIHSLSLLVAIFVFAHPKNTTLSRLPLLGGWKATVSRLDTLGFLIVVVASSGFAWASAFSIENYFAAPAGQTVFPEAVVGSGRQVDFLRSIVEGVCVVSLSALAIYFLYRLACLHAWLKSGPFIGTVAAFGLCVCLLPVFVSEVVMEFRNLRSDPVVSAWAPRVTLISPIATIVYLFDEMGSRFPRDLSTIPTYLVNGSLFVFAVWGIRRRERRLQSEYLDAGESQSSNSREVAQSHE